MRSLNASLSGVDSAPGGLSRRRHPERKRANLVARVAQERSDAAAAPAVPSSSDRTAADAIGSSQFGQHAAVIGLGAGLPGFQQQHNGNMPQGLSGLGGGGGGSSRASTGRTVQNAANNGSNNNAADPYNNNRYPNHNSSSGPSQQWLQGYPSSSSGAGDMSQSVWQPPSFRRSGLRLRSKRALQAAEKIQQSGRNLVVEELQELLSSSNASSTGSRSATAVGEQQQQEDDDDDRDTHLEDFIEQMLSRKSSMWKRSEADSVVDGREAIDPDLLAAIHTVPVEQVAQQQALLVQGGQLLAALLLLEEATTAGRRDIMQNTEHKAFLRAAGRAGNTGAVLRFLQLLPAELAYAHTYNLALKACADAKDLRAALRVVDMMGIRQVPTDFLHFTTLITVCSSIGDANQAFAVFQKAKAAEQQLAAAAAAAAAAAGADKLQQKAAGRAAPKMDGHVYGALIAACAQAIRVRSSDLREQLVILERAFQVLQEAEDAGVYLETPVWNALLMCAGRCRQMQRCFEVLDRMTAAGVPSDSITYTCLVEAAVLSGDVNMAQRVFARAMGAGVTNSVQLYTAAINACMTDDRTDFDAAFEIYTTMQRHGVEPDDLLYGHLIAIAGRCRKLEVAFDLLEDMRASGLTPSTPTCSALIYACLQNNNFAAARKVYDTLVARGVPPHISQYNSLMEQYALRFQLGNVVSVLTNMVAGGVQPNANTFRILILACQRTDQAELAFELYQIMKARALQPRLNNAHSICYTLLTACFSRIRKSWWPGGYPPKPLDSMGPYSNLPGLRPAEARQLLHVLQPGAFQGSKGSSGSSSGGSSSSGGGGAGSAMGGSSSSTRQQQQGRRYMFLDNADNINWPLLALSTYRDFISWGYKPHLEVLDKLLSCLRLQLPKSPPRPPADLHQRNLQLQAQLQPLPHPDAPGNEALGTGGSAAAGSAAVGQQQGMASSAEQQQQRVAMLRGQAREASAQNAEDRPYEVPFDKRALDAVGDAISMGLLPAIKLDAPFIVDMRGFPPSVAEAYTHMLMSTVESRATSAAEGNRQPVSQRIRLIVPPFDSNYVMWPSYVEKLHVHYNEQLLARQAQLRAEAMAARARAAAFAAQNYVGDEDDEDMEDNQLLLTFGGLAARRNGDPAMSAAMQAAMAHGRPLSAAAAAAAAAGRGRRGMMLSWDVADFGDGSLSGADFTGYTAALTSSQPGTATAAHGRYIAGAVTGLAAAATFRRLKAYCYVDAASGTIKLDTKMVNAWLNAKLQYEKERRRVARGAEIAAAGYSSALPYYQPQQQQQQQAQQRTGGGNSWQQQQAPPQQEQQFSAGGQYAPAGSSGNAAGPAAAAAGSPQRSAGGFQQRPEHAYNSIWEQPGQHHPASQQPQQQPQQPQPFMPGFGLQGPAGGMPGLQQQARDIRLSMAPAPAAAAGLARPDRAVPQGQQQAAHGGPGQQQHEQAPPSAAAAAGASSAEGKRSGGSGKGGSGRSRRSNKQAASAGDAAAAASGGGGSGASSANASMSSTEQQ